MTDDHAAALRTLSRCSMLPGSWDKRFVRNLTGGMDGFAGWEEKELSAKQIEMVEKLTHKYRKQIARKAHR